MIAKRRSEDRGAARFDWLDSKHSFSFGHYFDANHMGFGPLRVINEDRVIPGAGFDEHGHRDMEIISYVLDGALQHRDSLGNGSVIHSGEIQRMSAGTGIRHSEYNASADAPLHFLQIWIEPEQLGLEPGYEERPIETANGALTLIGSRDGRDGSLTIHRDVDLYVARLNGSETARHELRSDRIAWAQVARGEVELNGERLSTGDGAAIQDEASIELTNGRNAEVLLFDMAARVPH